MLVKCQTISREETLSTNRLKQFWLDTFIMSPWENLGENPLSRNDATRLFKANSMAVADKPQLPPSSTMPGPPLRAQKHVGTTANIYANRAPQTIFCKYEGKGKDWQDLNTISSPSQEGSNINDSWPEPLFFPGDGNTAGNHLVSFTTMNSKS